MRDLQIGSNANKGAQNQARVDALLADSIRSTLKMAVATATTDEGRREAQMALDAAKGMGNDIVASQAFFNDVTKAVRASGSSKAYDQLETTANISNVNPDTFGIPNTQPKSNGAFRKEDTYKMYVSPVDGVEYYYDKNDPSKTLMTKDEYYGSALDSQAKAQMAINSGWGDSSRNSNEMGDSFSAYAAAQGITSVSSVDGGSK